LASWFAGVPAAAADSEEDEGPAVGELGFAQLGAPSELGALDWLSLLRNILLMLDTLGTLNLSQTPSLTKRSFISQAKMPGSRALSSRMNSTTLRAASCSDGF